MVTIRGRLAPEVGAVLVQALAAARETLYQQAHSQTGAAFPADAFAETPTMAQQQADALALLAETALRHGIDPGAPGERYQVVVHVDAAVLADADALGQSVLEDGARVSAETSQRLACDASRVVMQHGHDGRVMEVAARSRTIPPALRRALHHRDRGCRFPGCGLRFGQGHHIRHWAHGGPTTLSNLALLCRRHHRAVHEEGYEVKREPDGELRFYRPNGHLLPEVPAAPYVPLDPVELLRTQAQAEGVNLHARTASSGWLASAMRSTSCIPWPVEAPDNLERNERLKVLEGARFARHRQPHLGHEHQVRMGAERDQSITVGGHQRGAGLVVETVLAHRRLRLGDVAVAHGGVRFQREQEAIERVRRRRRKEVVRVHHTGHATTALPWCQDGS